MYPTSSCAEATAALCRHKRERERETYMDSARQAWKPLPRCSQPQPRRSCSASSLTAASLAASSWRAFFLLLRLAGRCLHGRLAPPPCNRRTCPAPPCPALIGFAAEEAACSAESKGRRQSPGKVELLKVAWCLPITTTAAQILRLLLEQNEVASARSPLGQPASLSQSLSTSLPLEAAPPRVKKPAKQVSLPAPPPEKGLVSP